MSEADAFSWAFSCGANDGLDVVLRKAVAVFVIRLCLPVVPRASAGDAPTSACYGTTANGRLVNGLKLPAKGNNFQTDSLMLHGVGRTYVHSGVHRVVTSAYNSLEQTHPAKPFVYGETEWAGRWL